MNKLRQIIRQDFLRLIELAALPAVHLLDLFHRKEGQEPDAAKHIGVCDISPVLIEVIRTGLFRIKPDRAAHGLAHLLALGVEQQHLGHGVRIPSVLSTDQLGAGQHIAPLVVAAELQVAAVILVEPVKIIRLHDHVVKLDKGQALVPSLLIAFRRKHPVYRKMRPDLTKQFHVIEVKQPVRIVDHERFSVRKINETAHLNLKALDIVGDLLLCEHFPHIGLAGRVADHACAAPEQGDRFIACHLQALHEAQGHKMSDVQAVRRRIKADVENGFSRIDEFPDPLLVRYLCNQASCFQFFIYLHDRVTPFSLTGEGSRKVRHPK